MNEALNQVLSDFESRTEPFTEHDVLHALDIVQKQHAGDSKTPELVAEQIIFNLLPSERHSDNESRWGTYYGPMGIFPASDGKVIESPPLNAITDEVVAYWERRADETPHPLLCCRYSDALWDLTRKTANRNPDIRFARNVIDKTEELVSNQQLTDSYECERLLHRALSIAASINDRERIAKIVECIIRLPELMEEEVESQHAELFAFDTLVDNRKVNLDESKLNQLVQGVEAMLSKATGGDDGTGEKDHSTAEHLAVRLATHYRKAERLEDVERVIRLYGEAALAAAEGAHAIAATVWIRQAYEVYRSFNLNQQAEPLLVKLQEASAGMEQEMRPISVSTEIPAEEMETVIEELTTGQLCEVLKRLSINFVADIEQAKSLVAMTSKESIFSQIFTEHIVDREGRVVAEVGPLSEDLDGHHILQLSRNMQFLSQVLRPAVLRMRDKFSPTAEQVVQCIANSPFYPAEQHPLLVSGVAAYLQGDYISSVHILIPQVESALRQLLKLLGQSVLKPHRNGAMMLKNMDEILRVPQVVAVLTDKITVYLRTLLCDQRGWNLRNEVCHGIAEPAKFNQLVADRVFMAVILLGQFEPSDEQP